MEHKYFGRSEHQVDQNQQKNIVAMVENALRPLAQGVGLDEAALEQAVDRDVSRRVARTAFDQLEKEGVVLESARVLDLGAGLGHASVEAVTRGCELFALEPGFEWCNVVRYRLMDAGGGVAVIGDGERLPFVDNEFDVIVSVGVLEHVRHPHVYLKEAHRVLKPGGTMFMSCENYMSFWEPHYQIAWLPLFPKSLASIYLHLRGRSSEFLRSSITYTTRPGVMRRLRVLGFQFNRERYLQHKLDLLLGMNTKFGKIVPRKIQGMVKKGIARVIFGLENLRKLFTPYIVVIIQKPK
jgi:ubiquinone/menaquinone biosynthesis C-methylase UbiE